MMADQETMMEQEQVTVQNDSMERDGTVIV